MMKPIVTFSVGSTADITRKVVAYRELFGVDPVLRVTGTVVATDGNVAWLTRGVPVVRVGRTLVTVKDDDETFQIDVKANERNATYALSDR